MTEIVTLAETKLYLRVDGDDEDATILTLIGAAIEAVVGAADAWLPLDIIPDRIKLAVLTHVTRAFDERSDSADLPESAARLIRPYRLLDV